MNRWMSWTTLGTFCATQTNEPSTTDLSSREATTQTNRMSLLAHSLAASSCGLTPATFHADAGAITREEHDAMARADRRAAPFRDSRKQPPQAAREGPDELRIPNAQLL